jgi:hypothetical protein
MDLVTLVTACALGADPRLMQALIWQQSGGNPWAVSVPGETSPRIYTSLAQAISTTRSLPHSVGNVRVGLAGLPVPPASVTRALFLPCWNVTIAAQQVAGLVQRCAIRTQSTAISCALSDYGGSWQKPNAKFAAAVIRSLISKQVPDFDMPKGTSSSLLDIATDTTPRTAEADSGPDPAPSERDHAWVSALFPLSQQHPGGKSKASPGAQSAMADECPGRKSNAASATPLTQPKGPFLSGSKDQGKQ